MNFSAENARRKWPCDELPRPRAAMVTALAALAVFCALAAPAEARGSRAPTSSATCSVRACSAAAGPDARRPVHEARVPPPEAPVPLPRPRPAEAERRQAGGARKTGGGQRSAHRTRKAGRAASPAPPQPSACRLALTEEIAIAPSIPDIHGPGGCGGEDLVRLEAIVLPDKQRVAVKPPATLRCAMASAIADWIRTDIVPLAAQPRQRAERPRHFRLAMNAAASTACAGAQLSEHGHANALDVGAIKLANGQSIVLTDRTVPRELRESVLHSVCARFMTVLGPDSDWYHEDHIHLDLMPRHNNYKICQWNVLDPLPKVAPLLPAERPDEAPPREVAGKDTDKKDTDKKDTDQKETDKPGADRPAAAKPDTAEPAAKETTPATTAPQTKKP